MEHILQFGINIDDDAIIRSITSQAEKKILASIKDDVIGKLFESCYYNSKPDPKRDDMSAFSRSILERFLEENKELLLDRAAEQLANKLLRTKAAKELVKALKTEEV